MSRFWPHYTRRAVFDSLREMPSRKNREGLFLILWENCLFQAISLFLKKSQVIAFKSKSSLKYTRDLISRTYVTKYHSAALLGLCKWICWLKWKKVSRKVNSLATYSIHGTFLLCAVGVCSLCGNSMLLYVSYKKKHLLKPAEFFIINLAISDLGMTVSLYPLAVTSSLAHRYD